VQDVIIDEIIFKRQQSMKRVAKKIEKKKGHFKDEALLAKSR
jgi:hypothetical protein